MQILRGILLAVGHRHGVSGRLCYRVGAGAGATDGRDWFSVVRGSQGHKNSRRTCWNTSRRQRGGGFNE